MLSQLRTVSADEQRPQAGSKQDKILASIMQHYADRKHRFELLAEQVVQDVVVSSGMDYVPGWITLRSADGGADFIGRLDVGQGLGGTRSSCSARQNARSRVCLRTAITSPALSLAYGVDGWVPT